MNNILKRTFIVLVVVAGAVSCGDRRPEGILSREEMVQVMEEMYLAEERVNQLPLKRDSALQVARALNERVFAATGTNDSTFRKSFDYYMAHPKEMEMIYTALVDTLQLLEQRTPYRFD